MIYSAEVLKKNENVEEELSIRVMGFELTCFAAICPYEIEIGRFYSVELDLMVIDKFYLCESDVSLEASIKRIGDGFSHLVTGILDDARVIVGGLVFEEEAFRESFPHLNGKMVSLLIDRIDAEFI